MVKARIWPACRDEIGERGYNADHVKKAAVFPKERYTYDVYVFWPPPPHG